MNRTIHIGISTCPNDTFAFHGLLTGKIDVPGVDLQFDLLDVQELNERLIAGNFDVAKGSYHAALLLSKELVVLDAGSALGFGVGPLLLAAEKNSLPAAGSQVLCPGEHTTASLLYRLFYPGLGRIENVVFSDIMPRLQERDADLGVCIHEGRFTWNQAGLFLVADLGDLWEQRTSAPLPLGGIFARRRLGEGLQTEISRAIKRSIEYGRKNRKEALITMRKYAQEFSDEVLYSHVDLYVNDWTLSLTRGSETSESNLAARSLKLLGEIARESKVISGDQPDLQIVG